MSVRSLVSPDPVDKNVQLMPVLTWDGILEKHKLSPSRFERMKFQLYDMTLIDILFAYPEGPRHDIVLYVVSNWR